MILLIKFSALNGFIFFGIANLIKTAVFIPLVSLIIGTGNLGTPISIIKSVADIFAFLIGIFVSKTISMFDYDYTYLYWICCVLASIAILLNIALISNLRQK